MDWPRAATRCSTLRSILVTIAAPLLTNARVGHAAGLPAPDAAALADVQKYERAIHVMAMLLAGFGFLMVFVRRYGRSALTGHLPPGQPGHAAPFPEDGLARRLHLDRGHSADGRVRGREPADRSRSSTGAPEAAPVPRARRRGGRRLYLRLRRDPAAAHLLDAEGGHLRGVLPPRHPGVARRCRRDGPGRRHSSRGAAGRDPGDHRDRRGRRSRQRPGDRRPGAPVGALRGRRGVRGGLPRRVARGHPPRATRCGPRSAYRARARRRHGIASCGRPAWAKAMLRL